MRLDENFEIGFPDSVELCDVSVKGRIFGIKYNDVQAKSLCKAKIT